MRFHMLQNVDTSLSFLRRKNVKLVNIRPDDITDGNPKLTLGLIWTIILHFQVSFSRSRLLCIVEVIAVNLPNWPARLWLLCDLSHHRDHKIHQSHYERARFSPRRYELQRVKLISFTYASNVFGQSWLLNSNRFTAIEYLISIG
jgi:Calponin homology (CH) domain